jgi:diguanylate cyclase (GGDEF)-like protein
MVFVGLFCALLMGIAGFVVTPPASELRVRFLIMMGISGLLCVGLIMVAVRVFIHGLLDLGEGMRAVAEGKLDRFAFERMPNREMETLKATFDEMVARLRETEADLKLHLAEAERQSMTDPLTGLFNRRSLEQLLDREVLLAERYGQSLSLVMIDLDNFKQINDTYGHAAGDYLLKAFADCCRATLRKSDLPFRFGGDEFVVALPQTNLTQAEQVVEKLRTAFATTDFSQAIAQMPAAPTLSIGVTEMGIAARSLKQLLSAADHAVYQAKRGGRDRICCGVTSPVA